MRSDRLSDYLEIWGIEDNSVIFMDGSVGAGFEINPMDPGALSDDALNQTAHDLTSFLNGLPSGIRIQFVRDVVPASGDELAKHKWLIAEGADPVACTLTDTRVRVLQEQITDGTLRSHRVFVFVRVPMQKASGAALLKGLMGNRVDDITRQAVDRQLADANRVTAGVESGLRQFGFCPKRLAGKDILDLTYRQWNPGRPAGMPEFDPDDVRPSLVMSDVEIDRLGFTIGNNHYRVLSLKLLPELSYSAMAAALGRLPFGSRLFVSIYVPDQTRELESLQTQRRVAYSMAYGKRTGVSDIDSTAKFNDLERLLDQMIANGERVFHFGVNVLLRGKDEDDLRAQVAETLSIFREMGGSEALEESLAAFDLFSQLAIPNARVTDRVKRIKTSNLADMLPVYGPWAGHETPRVVLKTRDGTCLSLDPFDSNMTNANQLISGASGAGKSFLTNILLLNMLKEMPRVFFVDIGGSYRRLCENLGGQYINLTSGSGIALNPFDLPPGETLPSPSKIKFLLGLIELMTKEHDQAQLPRLARAEIENAIIETYRANPNPVLSDLRKILLQNEDPAIKAFGRILAPWCGNTPFGQMIDRRTTVDVHHGAIAFDLKGMESYPDLQAVCLFIITDLVWREIQKDRSTMKFLVFDECWKLLKSDSGLAFIEEVFRTFRKYYASAIAISQDIDDFAKSKIAGAILPNCALKWLLLQPQGDKTRLREVLALNDNEVELVSSLTQDKGRYSEAFLMAGEHRIVAVVEATPMEHWIATTDPRDLSKIDELIPKTPEASRLDVLKTLANQYPNGVSAGLRG
jgi:conjugal transfer ATP-binding protein TraC